MTERDAMAPAFGAEPALVALAKQHGGLPVIANGRLHDPERAERILCADVVSLARGALANMDWPRRVAAGDPLEAFSAEFLQTLRTL